MTAGAKGSRQDWLRALPVTLVMGGIFFLSHQPGSNISLPEIIHLDKLLHCLAYAVLGLAALWALSPRFRQHHPLLANSSVVLFCLGYGITDEFHQSFIPSRSSDLFDVLADGAGGLLAIALSWSWLRWRDPGKG